MRLIKAKVRGLAIGTASASVAIFLLGATASPVTAAVSQVSAISASYVGTATLTNVNSGKCLEVHQSSTSNYGNVDQWSCNGTATQLWNIYQVGTTGGYPIYEFINANSGKCMEVYHSETGNGANVDQYTCNGTHTQEWIPGDFVPGPELTNYNSGLKLTVQDGSTADGANVYQYAYTGRSNQAWSYHWQ